MGVIYLNGISYAGGGPGGQSIQIDVLPLPTATELGKIYQYIGPTTATYTNGYFYKCLDNSGTYEWQQINVQPGGSGGSTSYEDLTNKPTINGNTIDGNLNTSDLGLVDNKTIKVDNNNQITIKNPPSLDGDTLVLTLSS